MPLVSPQSIVAKISRVILISPNGFAYIASGLAVLTGFYFLGNHQTGYSLICMIGNTIGAGVAGFGIDYYRRRLKKYFRVKKIVQKHGINVVHVKLHQSTYCDRQIYKAVADSLGFNAEYKSICNEYRMSQQNKVKIKIETVDRLPSE